jgi:hypothetical protein
MSQEKVETILREVANEQYKKLGLTGGLNDLK